MLAVQHLVDAGVIAAADAEVLERVIAEQVSTALQEMLKEVDLWRRRAEGRAAVSICIERARQRAVGQIEQLLYTLQALGHDYLDAEHATNCAPCRQLLRSSSGGGA